MSFIEDLLESGPNHKASLTSDGAAFKPVDASEKALVRFQSVASEIIENDGDGYEVFKTHKSNDRPGNLIDRVLVTLD